MTSFNNTKKQYWKYYKIWMGERTYCAILKQEVLITRKGWDHLVRKRKGRKRSLPDIHRRLKLLKIAKHIIFKADNYKQERINGVEYLALTKNFKKNHVKVILKKNKEGGYFFFSVMDK